MATIVHTLLPAGAGFLAATFPQFVKTNGTNFPVEGLGYDAAADEAAFWSLPATAYGSGNLTLTIFWYADTATSGVVRWGGCIAAITANTDTQDVETKAFATETTFDDTHLATTGQRLHSADVTISNLDAIAVGDSVWLRIRRIGSNAADTMTGDAILTMATLSYSDV